MNGSPLKLGLIGGAGPLASSLVYQFIIEKCYAQRIFDLPEIVLENFSFIRGDGLADSLASEAFLTEGLQTCFDLFHQCGVQAAGIACNTLHLFLPRIDVYQIEVIHMPHLVAQKAKEEKISSALILGTRKTVEQGLYREIAHRVKPLPQEQDKVEEIIDRILHGSLLPSDSEALENLVREIEKRQLFEGVILGCTELPVLHRKYPLQLPKIALLDSLDLLAEGFLDKIKKRSI